MSYQFVRTDIDNKIATVFINRPPLNTLNTQIIHEVLSMIDELEARNDITGIVITGEGEKAFVTGNDLIQFQQLNPYGLHELTTISRAAFSRIERVSKPIVAAINGLALDRGLELALACDYCVCSENARFVFPEIEDSRYGGVYSKRMEQALRKEQTNELIYNRSVFNAKIAQQLEIVDEIIAEEDLLTVARDWARKLSLKDVI